MEKNKNWIFKEEPSSEQVDRLSGEINVNPVLASLLVQRGITNYHEAKQFFRPSLEDLHDPFLMHGLDKAADRIGRAMINGEGILVYGDYDVDGTTSVALFYGFLRKYYDKLNYYIPDRYKEGYGVSYEGVRYAVENDITLVITLDCGIKAFDEVQEAQDQGVDFIICDHHTPGEALPPAYAVLDPKQENCAYPYKELSGCGVGFKLLQGVCRKQEWPESGLFVFLDLLAVSISSDIVPVTGENRIFSWFGLKQLNENPNPGLKALTDIAGFRDRLTTNNIVFGIGPRINAAGRVSHAHAAVELLLEEDAEKALQFAQEIDKHNVQRQDLDSGITEEALGLIQADPAEKEAYTTVLYKEDWHKGVIGIVASRCLEKYHRPTIILTRSREKIMGSARSVPGFDLYEAINECSDLLEQFGGHKYAAGLSMPPDNLKAFRDRFEEVVRSRISSDMLVPRIEVDAKLDLKHINFKFYNILAQMAPFGPLNLKPVFVSEDVFPAEPPRVLKDKHLKLKLRQENSGALDAIGFGLGEFYNMMDMDTPFSVCYTLEENIYNGNRLLQMNLKDIKIPVSA